MFDQWAITTGVWKTRRKTFCYVTAPDGEVKFQHRRFWPCVAFLDAHDVTEYIIRPDEEADAGEPFIHVQRKEDAKWQK